MRALNGNGIQSNEQIKAKKNVACTFLQEEGEMRHLKMHPQVFVGIFKNSKVVHPNSKGGKTMLFKSALRALVEKQSSPSDQQERSRS